MAAWALRWRDVIVVLHFAFAPRLQLSTVAAHLELAASSGNGIAHKVKMQNAKRKNVLRGLSAVISFIELTNQTRLSYLSHDLNLLRAGASASRLETPPSGLVPVGR